MTSLFRPKTFPGIAFGLSVDVIDLVIFLSIVTVNFVFLPCTRISDMVTFSSLTIFYGFGNKVQYFYDDRQVQNDCEKSTK